jgi:uncharacterized membrane protein
MAGYDTSSPWFLPLRFVHIVGAMALLGALLCYLVLKVQADRSGDPGHASRTHRGFRRADDVLIAPAALAVFAGGYSIIRFLGSKIAEHWFAIWGLILFFVALGFWYFGVRRLNKRLAEEADACAVQKQPLSTAYGAMSVAWLACASLAVLALLVAAFVMVFRVQLGIS